MEESVSCEMSYSFLVNRGYNWDVMSPWHNFLEGVQGATGPEEAQAEAAKPAWSSSLAGWETELDVSSLDCLIHEKANLKYSSPCCSLEPGL